MAKRHGELLCVFLNLVKDARHTFPSLGKDFDRDVDSCRIWEKNRGDHLFLVDLPRLAKHLDRCLDSGQYIRSNLPCGRPYGPATVIPKFLRGLYLLIFSQNGILREDCCTDAVFFLRQILCFGKKAPVDCSSEAYDKEVKSFVASDSVHPEPFGPWVYSGSGEDSMEHRTWKGSYSGRVGAYARGAETGLLSILDVVSGVLTATLGHYDPQEWRHKHGPGAVSDRSNWDNRYKWLSWSDRLESVFPICRFGFSSYSAWAGGYPSVASDEGHSKMVAVPKSYNKPRLIACEPSASMWCQQNIWNYFRSRSEATWISDFCRFGDQGLNQQLCLLGSADSSLATLDLSNASDSVSCLAVSCLFRVNPGLIRALSATRTQNVLLPSGEMHKLRMYATMGNATTFPVESLMFLAIAISAVLSHRNQMATVQNIKALKGEVAVFGDDIIVPKDSVATVTGLLEACGFKVNVDKSFSKGNFRESCGVDSFRGVNVTPVYWKGPVTRDPESVVKTVQVRNNFYKKMLLQTARYLTSTLQRSSVRVASVAYGSGVFGLYTRWRPDFLGF